MHTPGSTSSSVSSPPPQGDADAASFSDHPVLLRNGLAAFVATLHQTAAAEIRRLALQPAPRKADFQAVAAAVVRLAEEVAVAERTGVGTAAEYGRRLRLILELYVAEAWQSWMRRSRARQLYRKLRAMAKEERAGQRKMSAACKKFNRVAAASWGNDEDKNENTTEAILCIR